MTICEEDVTQCPVFKTMSPAERQNVQQIADYLTFEKGRTILRERDHVPQGLWMLQRGKVEVVKDLVDGSEQKLTVLEPGAIFGEISFFDPAAHSATIRAVEESEFMFLAADKIDTLRILDLSTAYKLITNAAQIMSGRLRQMGSHTHYNQA